MKTIRPITTLGVVTGLILTACGGGDDGGRNASRFDGDKKDVAAVVDRLETASRDGEAATICEDIFSLELQRLVTSQEPDGGCEARVKREQVNEKARIDVQSVDVSGEKATASVREQDGDAITLNFVKSDGDWRILSIVG